MDLDLEKLIRHEIAYASIFSRAELTPIAAFLECREIPDLWEGNRALRLRDDGRGPEKVADEVMERLRRRTARPVVDIDEVAESQGIGRALRKRGMRALTSDWLLMRLDDARFAAICPSSHPVLNFLAFPPCDVATFRGPPDATGPDESETRSLWIDTTVTHEENEEDRRMWRAAAQREAVHPDCRCYLGSIDGIGAGTCLLVSNESWGRIEEVATRPDFRNRGVASALVHRAAADSVELENTVTYLFTERGGKGESVYSKLGFVPWAVNLMTRYRA